MNAIEENKLRQQYFEEVGKANATPAGFNEWLMSKKPSPELSMFENEIEWVIAKDSEDAFAIVTEIHGYDPRTDYMEDEEWKLVDPESEFVYWLDEYELCHDARMPASADITATAKVKDWIKERGRGYFATSER